MEYLKFHWFLVDQSIGVKCPSNFPSVRYKCPDGPWWDFWLYLLTFHIFKVSFKVFFLKFWISNFRELEFNRKEVFRVDHLVIKNGFWTFQIMSVVKHSRISNFHIILTSNMSTAMIKCTFMVSKWANFSNFG